MQGSSPRMRGKRCISFSLSSGWGLIPAHAGKTRASPATSRQPTAHPRACGENIVFKNAFAALNGSSPRMRGKRRRRPRCARRSGLIPAHAGKTRQPCYQQSNHPAHPRACGENLHIEGVVDTPYGSSPRMRGKRSGELRSGKSVRLIPAHAGKTLSRAALYMASKAHPRACGENMPARPRAWCLRGSSPRMRGKLTGATDDGVSAGLIPAHAGKTAYSRSGSMMMTAHPRACGENLLASGKRRTFRGSSPRMRGKRLWYRRKHRRNGLIPAHAGKTFS